MNCKSYQFVENRLSEIQSRGAPKNYFEYDGENFVVFEGVFSPAEFLSTKIFTKNLHFTFGESFLEIGCGAGLTAVVAARSGCRPVVATDINPAAVANTQENASRHGVGHLVSVRQGDLFDVLQEGELFDTIYWNSPFVFVPNDYACPSSYHKSFFDPGYAAHDRYLREAGRYLAPNGTLLLGFSSLGDEEALRNLCATHGYEISVQSSECGVAEGSPRYDILRLDKGLARSRS